MNHLLKQALFRAPKLNAGSYASLFKQSPQFLYLQTRDFGRKIFVQQLPDDWTPEQVHERFSVCGKIDKLNIIKN